ncbi:MAG TPA: hypothetical protein VG992_04415 [Candidatus Saccharimonadales bacterium]|nr:hypothetical protein [Candidatus Saccharimonadales bacterium]
MKQRLTLLMNSAALLLVSLFGSVILTTGSVAAAATDCSSAGGTDSAQEVLQGVGQVSNDCSGDGVKNITQTVVEILSYVVGIVAIIMVIIAAFRYITSGGDSNKTASAKSTLIYAMVGLAVAALAQLLVHTVLGASVKAAGG